MKKYTVIAVLSLAAGTVVGLSHAQAAPRAHNLRPLDIDDKNKMGRYEVVNAIQFKVGETVWCQADLPKGLATVLEEESVHQQRTSARAKDSAESKEMAALRAKVKKLEADLEDQRAEAARVAALGLDAEIATAREKAALWDTLPELIRADAIGAAAQAKADAAGKAKS